jgi:hypothetical protein
MLPAQPLHSGGSHSEAVRTNYAKALSWRKRARGLSCLVRWCSYDQCTSFPSSWQFPNLMSWARSQLTVSWAFRQSRIGWQ